MADVWLANYNSPGQVVISGTPEGVAPRVPLARERGAKRVLPLPVSGAFHTPLMAGAARGARPRAGRGDVRARPPGRFFSTTEVRYPETWRSADVLARQLMSPVRFTQSMEALHAARRRRPWRSGRADVLAGLVKRIASRFPVYGTDTGASLEDAINHATAGRGARAGIEEGRA